MVDRESFTRELAPARTFALLADVEWLHRRGLGLGGDLENCIVFGPDGPTNTGLRFADEPVRHKALDVIGDLALAGGPVWAHVEVERGGHQVHFSLLEAMRERPGCWTCMEGPGDDSRFGAGTFGGRPDFAAELAEGLDRPMAAAAAASAAAAPATSAIIGAGSAAAADIRRPQLVRRGSRSS